MDNNSICYDEIRTGNRGEGGVKKYCFEISDWSGSPTIRKVIKEGVTILFYHYEINVLSIFSLKQIDVPTLEM